MKIFNVSLRVSITQVADIPDNPPEPPSPETKNEPFNDDPLHKQEKILNSYLDRLEKIQQPPRFMVGIPGELGEGASMAQNVKITADDFEDLSAILKKFSDVAKQLSRVPDSIVAAAADPLFPPIG